MHYVTEHKRFLIGIVALLLVLGFLTYSFISPKGMFSGLQNDLRAVGGEEGESPYTDLDGVPVDLERFKGKPLVVNAWATWMPFSKDELHLLTEAARTHGGPISFVAMNRMEDPAAVRAYLSFQGIGETLTFLLDPTDRFYTTVGGFAMPETLFYAGDGTLVFHKRGVLTREELESALVRILK